MELQRLEKYKGQFKDFTKSIDSFERYLSELYLGVFGKNAIIAPFEVSNNLHIPELDAIFLLSLAEKEHIVKKIYKVFSNENTFLDEYYDPQAIPKKIPDPETGKLVDRSNYYVDLVYEFAE